MCYPAEIFEPTEHPLNHIAPTIGLLVIGMQVFAGWGWVWRYDGLASAFCQPVTQPPCVIGTVREQTAWDRDARQKLGDTGQVMCLARRQTKRNGPARLVGQGMNLGRPSAARPSNGLCILPPFPPDAERWALIEVMSALVVPTTPEEPDKAWKTSSHTLCLDHRLKRL